MAHNYRSLNKLPIQRVHIKVNKPNRTQNIEQKIIQPRVPQVVLVKAAKPIIKQQPKQKRDVRVNFPIREHKPRLISSSVNRLNSNRVAQFRAAIEGLRGIGRGRILVIVACGPSVLEAPLEKLKDNKKIDIMCINRPDSRIWPSRYWAFCDQSQYTRNKQIWEKYNGTTLNASSVRAPHKNQVLIKSLSGKGFSRDLVRGYHVGRSSTYANIQTAVWMQYDKIYIFGVDMCSVSGKLHFYGQNPDVANDVRLKRFDSEAESYMSAVNVLTPEERQKIFFCSSYNKYKFAEYFGKLDQKTAVDIILNELKTIE